jgi:hypothetical protein
MSHSLSVPQKSHKAHKAHKAQKISSDMLTHFFVPFVILVPFVALLNREVFGLRMVDNNSRSRLLWL